MLQQWNRGQPEVLEQLLPLLMRDLRNLAWHYLQAERGDHTLQPTALVNELYMKLVDRQRANWRDRSHFLAFAAQTMRRILVDHARGLRTAKRGRGIRAISLDQALVQAHQRDIDLIALDDALETLKGLDARQSQLIELRFFGGLSTVEAAEVLGVGTATVVRDWASAKAWLFRELSR